MNAANIERTTARTVSVFGMKFTSAENAMRGFGFTNETGAILSADWYQDTRYRDQPCTVREIHGEVVLVRDLGLKGRTVLDSEKLLHFYVVEGRTLCGTPRLYALNFTQQEDGPAEETWTELHPGTVRTPYAVDDDGDTRRVIIARLDDGRIFVKVTGQEAVRAWMLFAEQVLDAERQGVALAELEF